MRLWLLAMLTELVVIVPDLAAFGFGHLAAAFAWAEQYLQMSFGMHSPNRVSAELELTGIVA